MKVSETFSAKRIDFENNNNMTIEENDDGADDGTNTIEIATYKTYQEPRAPRIFQTPQK
jgi:hypothetical protein